MDCRQRGRACAHQTAGRPRRPGSGQSAPHSPAIACKLTNMKKSVLGKEDMSPEIALRVVLKLLPVEPVLIRPHPDSNLWDGVFSHFCLFVCYFPAPQVSAGGNSGGKHSQPGSSLHKQSHTLLLFVFSRTKQQSAVVFCDLHPSTALLTDHGNLTEGRASCAIFICF